jgi:hypothetical protein
MSNAFSIGKRGPTIHQGANDPNGANQVGFNGDLYVQVGNTPKLYQFRVNNWVDVTGEVFTRTPVSTSTYSASDTDFYLGLRVANCTVQLPAGTFGKKFILKDEVGGASPNTPIEILAANGETIDGEDRVILDTARASLTLIYGVEWHIV